MAVAKIIEISAASPKSFDEAVVEGVRRAGKTVNKIQSAWVKEMSVEVANDAVVSYRVILKVTFLLDE